MHLFQTHLCSGRVLFLRPPDPDQTPLLLVLVEVELPRHTLVQFVALEQVVVQVVLFVFDERQLVEFGQVAPHEELEGELDGLETGRVVLFDVFVPGESVLQDVFQSVVVQQLVFSESH